MTVSRGRAGGANVAEEAGGSLVEIARERGYAQLTERLEARLRERWRFAPEGDTTAEAIRGCDAGTVRALLSQRPELVHAADALGNQPLHWAMMTGQMGLFDLQLGLGGRRSHIDALKRLGSTGKDGA